MKFNQNDVLDAQLFMTAIVIVNKRSFIRHVKDSSFCCELYTEALKTIFLQSTLHIGNLNFHCAINLHALTNFSAYVRNSNLEIQIMHIRC